MHTLVADQRVNATGKSLLLHSNVAVLSEKGGRGVPVLRRSGNRCCDVLGSFELQMFDKSAQVSQGISSPPRAQHRTWHAEHKLAVRTFASNPGGK